MRFWDSRGDRRTLDRPAVIVRESQDVSGTRGASNEAATSENGKIYTFRFANTTFREALSGNAFGESRDPESW